MQASIRYQVMAGNISEREKQVLRLISSELTTDEIARELFISAHTVISHRRNLMVKLEVKNSAGMVRRGFETGLLNIHF